MTLPICLAEGDAVLRDRYDVADHAVADWQKSSLRKHGGNGEWQRPAATGAPAQR